MILVDRRRPGYSAYIGKENCLHPIHFTDIQAFLLVNQLLHGSSLDRFPCSPYLHDFDAVYTSVDLTCASPYPVEAKHT